MNATTWDLYWSEIGSEEWLAAKALLELSPTVRNDAAQWLPGDGDHVDWDGWVASVDENGRGWSSTEKRLFEIVVALVSEEPRAIPLRGLLDSMGSWETDVWRILAEWGTGGNNLDRPGRVTVVRR